MFAQQNFTNVAQSVGINNSYGDGLFGGGVSFYDFNKDGWDDLTFASQNGDSIYFYKNLGGSFQLMGSLVSNTTEQKQINWVDFDNDGDADLFVASYLGGNRLYRNNGNLNFTDVTAGCGISTSTSMPTFGACWVDANKDGYLDLYILNRGFVGINQNFLYKNNGDGTFTDVTLAAGLEGANDTMNVPFCASFFDYNNDGWSDAYVAVDKHFGNTLFSNNGNGTYTDISRASGAYQEMDGMCVAIGDYDGNGYFDIYTSNTASALGNVLLSNNGDSTFTNVATTAGVTVQLFSWGSNFFDYDNDGDLDLYVCSSEGPPNVFSPNRLFRNEGNGAFSQMSYSGMTGDTVHSYSNAIGDFNNDGYPDIAVNNEYENFDLWQNSGGTKHWVKIALRGVISNRDAIGTRIEVYTGGTKQMRYTSNGIAYLAQSSGTEIVGLGTHTMIDSIKLYWPSGVVDRYYNLQVDRKFTFIEGKNQPFFNNVANAVGINHTYGHGEYGGGVSFFDFNKDGWDDLTLATDSNDALYFYQNMGGDTFQRVSPAFVIDSSEQKQINWVDFDNDGDYDLFLVRYNKGNKLYENTGNMNFVDITDSSGITTAAMPTFAAAWADIDKDGYLDLYFVNRDFTGSYYNYLYKNNGDGTFTDITTSAGVAGRNTTDNTAYAMAFLDYNNDGWDDIYIAQDKSRGNILYSNNHDGTFTDVSSSSGTGVLINGMAVAVDDYDGNDYFDIYSTNTPSPGANFLFQNHGDSTFSNTAIAAGVQYGVPNYYTAWGANFLDMDNDGDQDLHVCGGSPYNVPYPNKLYKNNGDGTFTDVSSFGISATNRPSLTNAIGDFDNDGYPDILVNNEYSQSTLWSADAGTLHYIKINLEGTTSNRDATGTRIEVFTNGKKQIRWTHNGISFTSQNSHYEIIGLGTATKIDSIRILWPLGSIDVFYNVGVDKTIYLVEGVTNQRGGGAIYFTPPCTEDSVTIPPPPGTWIAYQWSTGDTTDSITVTQNGSYYVTVTNQWNLDTVWGPLVVTFTDAPEDSLSGTDVLCYGTSTGTVTASVTGGVPPYTYIWNYPGSGTSLDSVPAGQYVLSVSDSVGCTVLDTFVVNEPPPLVLDSFAMDLTCNNDSSGKAWVTVSGGTVPYYYFWSDSSAIDTTSMLKAGSYQVTVADSNGCMAMASVTINEPDPVTVSYISDDATCNGAGNGQAEVLAGGGIPTYQVLWNDSSTAFVRTDLVAAPYSFTVTDANGCSASDILSISQPAAITFSATTDSVSCSSSFDGGASITPMNGAGGYSILWDDNDTNFVRTGITSGVHVFTITDANGCQLTDSVTVYAQIPLVVSGTVENVSCFGLSDGAISLNISGGNGAIQVLWSPISGAQNLTNLPADTYTAIVSDAGGCTDTSNYIVTQPAVLSSIDTSFPTRCSYSSDGEALVTPQGGTPGYSIHWTGAFSGFNPTNLPPGNHIYEITDTNMCFYTDSVYITAATPLSSTSYIFPVACNGGSDGSISLVNSGGTPPYTVNWTPGGTANPLNNIGAGTYQAVVIDSNGCTDTSSYTVNQPAALGANLTINDASCFGAANGMVIVSPTGGTPGYSISWSTGQLGFVQNGLAASDYSFTMTDNHSCTYADTVTINQPTDITQTAVVDSATCFGVNDGSVTLTVSGGTPGYTASWATGDTGLVLSNVTTGSYLVVVYDASGCTDTSRYFVHSPVGIQLNISGNDVSCYGLTDGDGTVGVIGGVTPYSISWSSGLASGFNPTGLAAGNYAFEVLDNNGCLAADTLTINQPNQLTYNLTSTDVNCNGQSNGMAGITVQGGVPGYSYSWSNAGTNDTIGGLTADTYAVTVTDTNGCQIIDSVAVNEPDPLVANTDDVDALCNGASSGMAWVTVTGGTPAYNYLWPGSSMNDTLDNLFAGQYDVTVTDANGCVTTATATIGEPTAISLSVTADSATGSLSDGSASVTASGGMPPYSYLWSIGNTTDTISHIAAGTYTVTVTDSRGCTETAIAQVDSTNTVGIDDLPGGFGLQVYPNPTSGQVVFNWTGSGQPELKLYNALGELIYHQSLHPGRNAIDLTYYAQGVYLYRLDLNGQLGYGRLIKE